MVFWKCVVHFMLLLILPYVDCVLVLCYFIVVLVRCYVELVLCWWPCYVYCDGIGLLMLLHVDLLLCWWYCSLVSIVCWYWCCFVLSWFRVGVIVCWVSLYRDVGFKLCLFCCVDLSLCWVSFYHSEWVVCWCCCISMLCYVDLRLSVCWCSLWWLHYADFGFLCWCWWYCGVILCLWWVDCILIFMVDGVLVLMLVVCLVLVCVMLVVCWCSFYFDVQWILMLNAFCCFGLMLFWCHVILICMLCWVWVDCMLVLCCVGLIVFWCACYFDGAAMSVCGLFWC